MDFIQAIVLSAVEGISEFLPISSTGHMVLTAKILAIPQTEFVKTFEIAIQSGAIAAVILLYGKNILRDFDKLKKVIIAFLPTAFLGLVFYKFIKEFLLGNTPVTLSTLLLGGIAIIALEKHFEGKNFDKGTEKLTYRKSIYIGLFQSVSMIPGVSRSAATIIGSMLLGLSRETAVEFSFLLAIPTMAAATGLDLFESRKYIHAVDLPVLLIGFLTAFLTAFIVVKWFLNFVRVNSLFWFGVYRIILAVVFFLVVR